MIDNFKILIIGLMSIVFMSCVQNNDKNKLKIMIEKTAAEILGNPNYLAISYGGYRQNTRDVQPTIEELKEDMKILAAMNIKFLRTYNVHFLQAANLLESISQLKKEDSNFEMYVMLGAWIDCKSAFNWENGEPNHDEESQK